MCKQLPFAILTFALLAFTQMSHSQIDKSKYASYKTTADSIVQLYYGDSLLQYIIFDSSKSYYRTLKTGGGGTLTKFTEKLEFDPEMFSFCYYLKHPGFLDETLKIKFYVDISHRIMAGFLPEGLYDMNGEIDLKIISKNKALEIAKKVNIKNPQNKYVIELGWHEYEATNEDYKRFNQTKDIKQIVKGRIVWKVTNNFKDPRDGKPYVYTFNIDAVTGEILSIERATLDWR